MNVTALASERWIFPDFAKGVLIFLVVLGHTIQLVLYRGRTDFWSDPLFQMIYMVHMPMFMALSGFFHCQSLRKRAHGLAGLIKVTWLLVPIFIWTLLDAFVTNPGSLFQPLTKIARHVVGSSLYSFWFLWVLAVFLLLTQVLHTLGRDRWWVFGLTSLLFTFLPDAWFFHYIKFLFPFFGLGYWVSSAGALRSSWIKWRWTLLAVAFSCLLFWFWTPDCFVYTSHLRAQYGWSVLARIFLGALIGGVAAFSLLWFWYRAMPETQTVNVFRTLGQASLGIYLLQGVLLDPFKTTTLSQYVGNHFSAILLALLVTGAALACVKVLSMNFVTSGLMLGRPIHRGQS